MLFFLLDIAILSVYNIHMKRVDYHLTLMQVMKLKEESIRIGLTVAEIIRRAIDRYFDAKKI